MDPKKILLAGLILTTLLLTGSSNVRADTTSAPQAPSMNPYYTPGLACGGKVSFSWYASDSATGYKIYNGNTLVSTVGANTTLYSGNPGAGTYNFGVSAFNSTGESSITRTTQTGSSLCVPLSVTCSMPILDPRVGTNIWWKAQAMGGPGGNPYDYEWSTTGLIPSDNDYVGGEGPLVTMMYTTPGVKTATVTATQGTTSGTATSTCSITVAPPFPSTPVITSAATTDMCGTNVAVQVGGSSYATGYTIYRSTSSIGTYLPIGTASNTSRVFNDTPPPGTYYYKIAGFNDQGVSGLSTYPSTAVQVYAPGCSPLAGVCAVTTSNPTINTPITTYGPLLEVLLYIV